LVSFYGCIVENLAVRLIPGFQEKKRGKWPAEIIVALLVDIEKGKQTGEYDSDLDGCIVYLKSQQPELARPKNRTSLLKSARTLQNGIAAQRAKFIREHAARDTLNVCEGLAASQNWPHFFCENSSGLSVVEGVAIQRA
jgi:hypothetical protein